jgi:hypothetical protein
MAREVKQEEISDKILGFFGKGWSVELASKDIPDNKIISPRGYVYETRKLRLNICTICEPRDSEAWCRHSDEDNREYEGALQLNKLIEDYEWKYGLPLPQCPCPPR